MRPAGPSIAAGWLCRFEYHFKFQLQLQCDYEFTGDVQFVISC